MSDPYLGEIRMVGFNFAPTGWAQCQGQLLPISQNQALFGLLGTYYGGNGVSNYQLPNLQGRTPVGVGQGLGLSNIDIGEVGGTENIALTTENMPQHTHVATVSGGGAVTGAIRSRRRRRPRRRRCSGADHGARAMQCRGAACIAIQHGDRQRDQPEAVQRESAGQRVHRSKQHHGGQRSLRVA